MPSSNKRIYATDYARLKVSQPKVLIYQLALPDGIAEYLEYKNFSVTIATDDDVVGLISKVRFDLYIIDYYKELKPVNLQLLRLIKEVDERPPVIMLSSLDAPECIINALNSGADNYITKPFNMDLLIAYGQVALRNANFKTRSFVKDFEIGPDYKYVSTKGELFYKGELHAKLAGQSQKLLALLCSYINEIVPMNVIVQTLWKTTSLSTVSTLRSLISGLRRSLKEDAEHVAISFISGAGYILEVKNNE